MDRQTDNRDRQTEIGGEQVREIERELKRAKES